MGIFFSKDRSPKKSTSIAPVPEANLDEYKNNIVDNITGKFKNDHSEKIHNFPKLTKALEFIDEVIPISSSFRVLYYDLLDCIKLLTIALESIKKTKHPIANDFEILVNIIINIKNECMNIISSAQSSNDAVIPRPPSPPYEIK